MDLALVAKTISLWRRSTFVWGQTDCVLAVCNYIATATGRDPAAQWRGTYHDDRGAQAIYEPYGGVLGLVRHGLALSGLKEAPRAYGRPVVAKLGHHEVAGIDMGQRVAFLVDGRGVIELPAEVLAAWAI